LIPIMVFKSNPVKWFFFFVINKMHIYFLLINMKWISESNLYKNHEILISITHELTWLIHRILLSPNWSYRVLNPHNQKFIKSIFCLFIHILARQLPILTLKLVLNFISSGKNISVRNLNLKFLFLFLKPS